MNDSIRKYGFNFDNSYGNLPDALYKHVDPVPVSAPEIIVLNTELATELGLEVTALSAAEQAALFAGNTVPAGAEPLAQAYAGHQFGHFTVLGDGRAVLWGEHITPNGRRVDIQFKGSGRTPYSRGGDGRAAQGPMLREYLISEALYALGIPSTRSLAVAATGEKVVRDGFVPGAILTRVASSHIRVGTFEFAARQDQETTEALLHYTIERHYPALKNADNPALALLEAVMRHQIDLVVHWMRVGFIHGVMNTDNMALSGESIDYGPCAFMDHYDPATVFSSIDQQGRYAYANQPGIAQWNLARLAETLLPFIHSDVNKAIEKAEALINTFESIYHDKWLNMMRSKLGLYGHQDGDEVLIRDLLDWMHTRQADFTNTFLDLAQVGKPEGQLYDREDFTAWYNRWQRRLEQNDKSLDASLELMQATNPAVIPRNHNVEAALQAADSGQMKPFNDLLEALKKPYQNREALKPYQQPPKLHERVYQTFCGT